MVWFLTIKNTVSKMCLSVIHSLILTKLLFPTMSDSALTDPALLCTPSKG